MKTTYHWFAVGILTLTIGSMSGCGGDDGGGASSAPAAIPVGATATLAWDPVNDPSIFGYNIHYGTLSGAYSEVVNVGGNTSNTIYGLKGETTYYFAVTAYNAGGESGFSKEVSKTTPPVEQPSQS